MYSSHLTTFWAKVTKMLVKTSFVLDLMQHGVKLYGFRLILTDFVEKISVFNSQSSELGLNQKTEFFSTKSLKIFYFYFISPTFVQISDFFNPKSAKNQKNHRYFRQLNNHALAGLFRWLIRPKGARMKDQGRGFPKHSNLR